MKIVLEKILNNKEEKVYRVKKIEGVLPKEKLPYRYLNGKPRCFYNSEKGLVDFYFEKQQITPHSYTTDSLWLIMGHEYYPEEIRFAVDMLRQCKQRLATIYKEIERDKREWSGEETITI